MMKKFNLYKKYESMIVLPSEYTDEQLKIIAFGYAKQLKKLGASDISIISRGHREFAYNSNGFKAGHFIELYFNSSPQIVSIYQNKLNLDKNVIRALIINLDTY